MVNNATGWAHPDSRMDWLIIALLLGAALLHSSWHAMIKAGDDRLVGLAGMNVVSAGISMCALPWVAIPEARQWPVLAFSVVLHNTYKFGLAQVYKHGELSQAYPIARGFCPLFSALLALVLLAEIPTGWQAMGIMLISGGILIMGTENRATRPSSPLLIAAAITGFLVASYTVVDAYGVRLGEDWLSYVIWLMVLDGTAFVATISVSRGSGFWKTIVVQWRYTLATGILGTVAFCVFLWALSRGPIGGVSALRETSVLFASLIGVIAMKERWSAMKFAGVLLIMFGIIAFAWRA